MVNDICLSSVSSTLFLNIASYKVTFDCRILVAGVSERLSLEEREEIYLTEGNLGGNRKV